MTEVKQRIYISGPISLGGKASLEEQKTNAKAFDVAAAKLSEQGYEAVNPTVFGFIEPDVSWADLMRQAIHLLLDCDGIFLLPNWHMSRGARIELFLALELGLFVLEG